jgi:hypothetical protein
MGKGLTLLPLLFWAFSFSGIIMNIFFPKDNSMQGYAEWVMGDKRVLFVTGLCGSGKTTMACDLGGLLGAKVIHLDEYLRPLIRAKLGENPDYEKAYYEHGVKMLLEAHPEGRIVIEGYHIAWFNPEELKEHAVLCVNTSFLKSCWRAIKRATRSKSFVDSLRAPVRLNLFNFKHIRAFSQLII